MRLQSIGKSKSFFYFELLLLGFLLVSNHIFAQNTIQVLESSTHKPMSSVNVYFKNLVSKKNKYDVTDKNGKVNNSATKTSEILISFIGYKTILDTITPNQSKTFYLEEAISDIAPIVCTGTFTPAPQDKSIYDIKVISEKEIKQQGATDLSELFQTRPNIRMTYDESLGSQIEMMGMSGNNVKIMVDGVSILGRLDGNIDLGQISTENIDHIEIVEGPMSVIYGNNALAGTINIVTRNTSKTKAQIGTQIESVGKYSGNLFLSHPFGNQSLSLNAFASHFNGVDFDKETRSQNWRPTTNYQLGLNYDWHKNDWNIQLKANGYYGKLLIRSDIFQNHMIYDTYYYTHRFDVSAEADKTFNENHSLKITNSYSFYDRTSQEYDKDLTTLKDEWQDKEISQNLKNGNCRIVYGENMPNLHLELQSGLDLNYDCMGGPRLDTATYESMGDYAAFINVKYKLNDKIELQPGIRYAYNTTFRAPLVYSLNLKYDFKSNICWRVSVAKGFRTPSLKELYYDFENSNHDIHGNSDLKAEYSYNINSSLSYRPNNYFSVKVSGYYNDLKNKIDLVQNTSISDNYYDYENIHKYESLGGNFLVEITPIKNVQLNIGGTITGRYNNYSDEDHSHSFNYSPDAYGNILYFESHSKIQCCMDYKYNGKRPFFYTNNNDQIQEGEEEAYHFMNISANRTFLNTHLKAALGIRNVFDVTDVKSVGATASVHSDSNTTSITYGRSFFIQATYDF